MAEQLDTQPGRQSEMVVKPRSEKSSQRGGSRLQDKVALITGGDSGIGRAIAIAFAKEGAHVAISYLNEHEDAAKTKKLVEAEGGRCIALSGDVGDEDWCGTLVEKTLDTFGRLDILINNAAEQHPRDDITKITRAQLERTFRTNIFSMFYLIQAALPHLRKGSSIINTASVVAYRGNPQLLDYAATKGAIIALTRSLALQLAAKEIRVNAVAPGPVWTPLIPSTFPEEKVERFGKNTPMQRAGEPEEVAPAFVFLASDDGSYISGQTIHVNGGDIVNG